MRCHMDGPGGHPSKWSKPVTRRQMLCGATPTRSLESLSSQRKGVDGRLAARGWGRVNGSSYSTGTEFPFGMTVLEMDGDDGGKTVGVYLMPGNCT